MVNESNTGTKSPLCSELVISQSPIQTKVNTLKTNKSTGPDNISAKLLKLAGGAIVPPLMRLYQFSSENNSVLSAWKTARLTPIFKKDDETECGNYRPVSLLSIPSKILESEVKDTLIRHIYKDNDLDSNRQWAHRSRYSTEYLLVHLTETWRRALDTRKVVAAAFIDFRKTFDSVPHATLLMKLRRDFGVTGTLLDWLRNYLNGRQQFTVINGVWSDLLPVTIGVPQGSV